MSWQRPLGIDPGGKGALVVYDKATDALLGAWDMPTIEERYGRALRKRLDRKALAALVRMIRDLYDVDGSVVEKVGGQPGQGSGFQFGDITGSMIQCLVDHDIEYEQITPGMWKKSMGLTNDKKTSTDLALKVFAAQKDMLYTKHKTQSKLLLRTDRCEAALLAKWGALR